MPESYGPSTPPVFSRSRLALEVAAELVGTDGWPYLRGRNRYLCLVVKRGRDYSFILTGYLDRSIKGE